MFCGKTFLVHATVFALGFCVAWTFMGGAPAYKPLERLVGSRENFLETIELAKSRLFVEKCDWCGKSYFSAIRIEEKVCPVCRLDEMPGIMKGTQPGVDVWGKAHSGMDDLMYPGFFLEYTILAVADRAYSRQ